MKIYFNDLLTEKNRIVDDKWVKGNTGNKLEVYFDDLDLTNSAINVRGVIEWADGSTTNELVLSKSIDRKYVYLYLPTLKTDGEIKFTLRIYTNDSLLQTTIFSRKVYNSVNASDDINITSSEYESLLKTIESSGVGLDEQVYENTQNIASIQETIDNLPEIVPEEVYIGDEAPTSGRYKLWISLGTKINK